MPPARPYQSSLLRLLHGTMALLVPLALALAVGSGKLMNEDWLRSGQLDHVVYSVHLLAWLLIAAAVLRHVAGILRKGGMALAGSMYRLTVRSNDRPQDWPSQVSRWFRRSA